MKCKKFLCLAALPFLLASCDLSSITREEANRMLQDVINKIEDHKEELKSSSYQVDVYLYDDNNTVSSHAVAAFNDIDLKFYAEMTGAGALRLAGIQGVDQLADKIDCVGKTYNWVDGMTVRGYDYVKLNGVKIDGQDTFVEKYHADCKTIEETKLKFREFADVAAEIDVYETNAFLVNEILNPTFIKEDLPNLQTSYISKADGSISAHVVNKDVNAPVDLYVDIVDYRVVGAKGSVQDNGETCVFDLSISYTAPTITIPEEAYETATEQTPADTVVA